MIWQDWQDWGVDNGEYQHGYGDGQDLSWEAQNDQPYESSVRVPYQRDVDDGGKRKNLTKLNNKARKKAKVDKDLKSKIIKRKTDTFLKMILPTGLIGADNLS